MPQNSQYYQQNAPAQTYGRPRRRDNRLAVPFQHAEPPAGAAPQTLAAYATRGGYDTIRRPQGAFTMPGLEQEVSDYVANAMMAQRATAQGQLDPGRYAHIMGGQPTPSPASQAGVGLTGTRALPSNNMARPWAVTPGLRLAGGSIVAPSPNNDNGGNMAIPPWFANQFAFAGRQHDPNTGMGSGDYGYTDESGGPVSPALMAQMYRSAVLNNPRLPGSDEARALLAAGQGRAYRGMGGDRSRAISAFARGAGPEPEGMTDLEKRRVDYIQQRGYRVPGSELRMSREERDTIMGEAVNRKRRRVAGGGALQQPAEKESATLPSPFVTNPDTGEPEKIDLYSKDGSNWLSSVMDRMSPEQFGKSFGTIENPYSKDEVRGLLQWLDDEMTGPIDEASWELLSWFSSDRAEAWDRQNRFRDFLRQSLSSSSDNSQTSAGIAGPRPAQAGAGYDRFQRWFYGGGQ